MTDITAGVYSLSRAFYEVIEGNGDRKRLERRNAGRKEKIPTHAAHKWGTRQHKQQGRLDRREAAPGVRICNPTWAGPASLIILAALVAKDLQGGIEDGEKTDALDCNPRALFNSDLGCQQVAGKHLRLFGGQTEFVREEWTQQLLVNGSASGGVKAAPDH